MTQTQVPSHFQLAFKPMADAQAIVYGPHVRFSVLTSRLIRLEYAPKDVFEDRPSQVFWYRQQPIPDFRAIRNDTEIEIETQHLQLRYQVQSAGFAPDTLSIRLKESGVVWRYGDQDKANLSGTKRTLDNTSGGVLLEQGLLSRSGWAVTDDSRSLVFNARGWLEPRVSAPAAEDLYFWGYGHDYQGCLHGFRRVSGSVPMLPRWALGNWWSRYWAYTQDELMGLMVDFRAHGVPLSVCIVDMDWHIVDTGRDYSGWTGYTWNRALFPDPEGFIEWLHGQGLKTALNLHPADGVRAHEEMYSEMARRMGNDPDSEEPVEFDIAESAFANAYFEVLHHPEEERGVDFWWVDWQHGEQSSLRGLDPLWWLNHLHFYDLGRDGKKRPFVFSRWGGLGNHRYPIGFSGDTYVSWETLAYQPYFTATAANVAYGWWSHDIGGHMLGLEEAELYTRWVQFGVFSPIFRLHTTKNQFHERRPWGFDAETLRVTRDAMQLRHALIPYVYSMAWRDHSESVPLVRPMYHEHSLQEEAYHCPQQYCFGSELVVAPVTSPADPDTGLSRQVVWLPEGDWYHLFSGEYFKGGGWHALYGTLEYIPVFAKAGAIVPLGPRVGWGGVGNPAEFDLHIFAGADNRFVLYEDDGETTNYQKGAFCLTEYVQRWQGHQLEFRIGAASGDTTLIPDRRRYRFHCHGVKEPERVTVQVDGTDHDCAYAYDPQMETLHVSAIEVPVGAELSLTLAIDNGDLCSHRNRTQETCHNLLRSFKLETSVKSRIDERLAELYENPFLLADYTVNLTQSQMRALLEVIFQVGVHRISYIQDEELILLWNNRESTDMTYQFTIWHRGIGHPARRFQSERGIIPRFRALRPDLSLSEGAIVGPKVPRSRWRLTANYLDLVSVTYGDAETRRKPAVETWG